MPRPGGGGKTYMGNARLKTFFHLDAFPKVKKKTLANHSAGGVDITIIIIITVIDDINKLELKFIKKHLPTTVPAG